MSAPSAATLNPIAQQRVARARLREAIRETVSDQRRALGNRTIAGGVLAGEILAPLSAWASRGTSGAIPNVRAPVQDALLRVRDAHLARVRASDRRRGRRQELSASLVHPLVFSEFLLSTVEIIPEIERGSVDGVAGYLSRWVVNQSFNANTFLASFDTVERLVAARELVVATSGIGKAKKAAETWRAERRAAVANERWERIVPLAREIPAADGAQHLAVLRERDVRRYTEVGQRANFYLWTYDLLTKLGYEIRWPLAAHVVAAGFATLTDMGSKEPFMWAVGSITNTVQTLIRTGNQVIFDDVVPKLALLIEAGGIDGPVVDRAAVEWDARTLSEEQYLVDPLYQALPASAFEDLEDIAVIDWRVWIGGAFTGGLTAQLDGPYRRTAKVPPFPQGAGGLKIVRRRWDYGMALGDTFSTHVVPKGRVEMPDPRPQYRDGSEFRKLNIWPSIHALRAELDDANVNEERVLAIIKGMNQREKAATLADPAIMQRLNDVLNSTELDEVNRMLRSQP